MLTVEEQKQKGHEYRKTISRKELGTWKVDTGRDLVKELITAQESTRVQQLVPLRHERMSASPFTFFRGSAILQAHDLAATPHTDFRVQACGDAHISNFGIFASPERRLVFDINDFDETLPAPFDCDIKRLVASIEICGRDRGFSRVEREEAVRQASRIYQQSMNDFSDMGTLEVWYQHVDLENTVERYHDVTDSEQLDIIQKTAEKALKKDNNRAVRKYTEMVDGKLRIKSDPPVTTPVRDLVGEARDLYNYRHDIKETIQQYRLSLPKERREIIDQYRPVEMAHKVVGIGSVGTQCWILFLKGRENGDPLVLQIKEANNSVLEQWFGASKYKYKGQRVVAGQRAIQTAGDILLGWMRLKAPNGKYYNYYVRQFWDAKGSFDLENISPTGLSGLSSACAWTLAHGHAKTGSRHMISGYLGKGDVFEETMVCYATAYADQVEADYEMFLKMI